MPLTRRQVFFTITSNAQFNLFFFIQAMMLAKREAAAEEEEFDEDGDKANPEDEDDFRCGLKHFF